MEKGNRWRRTSTACWPARTGDVQRPDELAVVATRGWGARWCARAPRPLQPRQRPLSRALAGGKLGENDPLWAGARGGRRAPTSEAWPGQSWTAASSREGRQTRSSKERTDDGSTATHTLGAAIHCETLVCERTRHHRRLRSGGCRDCPWSRRTRRPQQGRRRLESVCPHPNSGTATGGTRRPPW